MTSHLLARANAVRLPLADASVDLVIGSPPYIDARLYLEDGKDLGISRKTGAWVEWMLAVTEEALRVSRGLVLWVVAGKTKNWTYQPAPEGLLWEWQKRGGSCFRPCYWHRVGIPGSGGEQWYRADVEYVLAFKRPGRLPYGDPKANGHPPKWGVGGEMSHRLSDGTRRNQWGHSGTGLRAERRRDGSIGDAVRPSHRTHTKRRETGEMEDQSYSVPSLANPGNILKSIVGGGQLGSPLAHENEAPYPVGVPAFFIRSHCSMGGLVLDPFSGSGSTGQAARDLGRDYIGLDLRQSQCLLGTRRLAEGPDAHRRKPAKPKYKPSPPRDLPGQSFLFQDGAEALVGA
jgi:hypothetical protein